MQFKVDENLPTELAELLRSHGYDAVTVAEERLKGSIDTLIAQVCQQENRILITLDLDFADIRAFPPKQYSRLLVLRRIRQDTDSILSAFIPVVSLLQEESPEGRLWIIEEGRVRIHD